MQGIFRKPAVGGDHSSQHQERFQDRDACRVVLHSDSTSARHDSLRVFILVHLFATLRPKPTFRIQIQRQNSRHSGVTSHLAQTAQSLDVEEFRRN